MLKLDGKALGIVKLAGKGEGLETLRHLKLEYEGKSGNKQRGILNPRAGWEADAREGLSMVESPNRWEKTISLCRTASGVDISDGILAATVLEHSTESSLCAHRTVLCVAGFVSTQRRCGGTTGLLDSLCTKPNPVPRCRWRWIRPVQCQVSLLGKALTARGKPKERARARKVPRERKTG